MSDLKGYRCPNCGQMLPISKSRGGIVTCEYCGSEYKVEGDDPFNLRIERIPFRSVRFSMQASIPRECCYNGEDMKMAFHYTVEELANALAEKLLNIMEIEVCQDIPYGDFKVRSSMRVAVPMEGRNPAEAFKELFESKPTVEMAHVGYGGIKNDRY